MLPEPSGLLLDRAGANLVHRLGGTWHEGGAMCRCPAHDDRTASLSVRPGRTTLLLKCFAGCPTGDVLRAIRQSRGRVPRLREERPAHASDRPTDTTALARNLWSQSFPLPGTPAERYLASRGIATPTHELRFSANVPLGKGRAATFRPALLAAVRERGVVVAVQRLFLNARGDALAPDLPKAKLTLGRMRSGAVALAPANSVLGLGEGVETALSASVLLGIPVWATLGNERLSRIAIPDHVDRLVLLPDNDGPGRHGASVALARYASIRASAEICWPWEGHNDWNDVLRAGGKRGERRARQTA